MPNKFAFSIIVLAVFLSILGASSARASTPAVQDSSTSVVCSATIFAVNTASITIRNINGGVVVSSISFGTISSTAPAYGIIAPQYVQLSINDNSILWLLRAYTTNFVSAPSTTTWGYQYGGLVSTTTTSGNHVAMGWQCSTSPVAPVCGDPQYSPTNGWTYMKDVWDVNPPGVSNESFVYAVGAGYCNIAYGSASYTRVVNPTNANGLPLASPSGNFYLFTEADFSNPSNDSYTFNLVLELIHQ